MKYLLLAFMSFAVLANVQAQDSTRSNPGAADNRVEIKYLSKVATSDKYGFTGEHPVKVGKGAAGGPANQRAYLSLLRDPNGDPVTYKRVGGGCCPYKSEHGFEGVALVDSYEVEYRDKNGKKKKTLIYISFYDYEEPMIPVGFTAAE